MSVPWKSLGARVRLSAMGWAVLALVLACTVVTVVVGVALFDITGHPPQFNSQ